MAKQDKHTAPAFAPQQPALEPVAQHAASTPEPSVTETTESTGTSTVAGVSAEVAAHRERTKAQSARLDAIPKIAPRFGPGRQVAETAAADPGYAKDGLLVLDGIARCARQDCGGGHPVPESREQLFRALDTLGWQKFRDKWFCSKMCRANEATSPSATLYPSPKKTAASGTPREVRPVHGHIVCERPDCGARVPVHGMEPERMVSAAIANGFVQTPDGVFCSHEHAREVVRGAHAAKTG